MRIDVQWCMCDCCGVCKVFAIDVVSHLSMHYALPKSLAVARLAVSVMNTMLTGMYVCTVHLSFDVVILQAAVGQRD